jgi:hypothetical protein
MIQILKKRVAPTNRAKEIEVTNTWKWLKKTPKDTYLSTWLRRWEETYEKATELNLPEASGTRPVLGFLDAIEPLSDKFHNYWTEHIQNLQDEDRTDEISDLYDILNKFRNRVRLRQKRARMQQPLQRTKIQQLIGWLDIRWCRLGFSEAGLVSSSPPRALAGLRSAFGSITSGNFSFRSDITHRLMLLHISFQFCQLVSLPQG